MAQYTTNQLTTLLMQCIDDAQEFDIYEDNDLLAYIGICLCYSREFYQDAFFNSILNNDSIAGNMKISEIFQRTRNVNWESILTDAQTSQPQIMDV